MVVVPMGKLVVAWCSMIVKEKIGSRGVVSTPSQGSRTPQASLATPLQIGKILEYLF